MEAKPLPVIESGRMLGGHKSLGHMDRLAQWQSGELPSPVTVELDLTDLCSHACSGCTFGYLVNVSKAKIPMHLASDIVGQLADIGVRGLTFSGGGEPLVYGVENVLELMTLAKQRGLDIGLVTNGSLLRPDDRYYDLCQWIRVSLDAYDAETFSKFHGRGAKEFDKVVSNLRQFAAHPKKGKLTLGVGFLTNRDSVHRRDFHRMAEFVSNIEGVDYLQFRPLVGNMVADPSLTGGWAEFSGDELASMSSAYAEASAAFSRPGFKVLASTDKYDLLSRQDFGRTYNKCLGHFLEATIGADAKVYQCCHGQGQSGFCLGDLRQQSFAEIWHGPVARKVYESINPQENCPPACRLSAANTFLQEVSSGYMHPNFI